MFEPSADIVASTARTLKDTTSIKGLEQIKPNEAATKNLAKERIDQSESLLEGAILVHGFCGNIDASDKWAEETKTLEKVLASGEIVSPSLRILDSKEQTRFSVDAPFDKNRVTFHVWKGDQKDGSEYIAEAFFASPTSILVGTIPSEDPAWPGRALSAYSKDGVRLSVDQGLLFITPERAKQFHTQLEVLAKNSGLTFADYMNKHVVLLPKSAFEDQKTLWSAVSSRIESAVGVTAKVTTGKEQGDSTKGLNFTEVLKSKEPTKRTELGLSTIKSGSAISKELALSVEQRTQVEIDWLNEVEADMTSNPYHIERLRDNKPLFKDEQQLADEISPISAESERLKKAVQGYDKLRQRLLAINEKVLADKFPNPPTEDELNKNRRPVTEATVYRGNDGKLHLKEPL